MTHNSVLTRKLTDEQVAEMRRRWRAGETPTALARAYDLCDGGSAALVIRGIRYKHVPGFVTRSEWEERRRSS